ncbi:outer membrane beta-barrel protein [candidate division KSB1 bacterium]|nr:outer membrane beta-barrel protein [candidate division KSB1 bacterium]
MRISKIVRIVFVAAFGLCFTLPAAAQYIGVLQSAETMDRGVFKLMPAPIMVFGKDGVDDEFGFAARAGYAFAERFDAEAKLGFSKNGTIVGADGEYWILRSTNKNSGLDISLTGGLHWMLAKDNGYDTMGFEITPQLSGHVTENLELCAALAASFESVKDAPPKVEDSYTRLHLVPGIEYRLSDILDLVAEFGIGINDYSSNYVGAGLSFYIR